MIVSHPHRLRASGNLRRAAIASAALGGILYGSSTPAETLYVSGHREIMLRTGPSGKHKILAVLETGDAMTRLETNGNYYRVALSDGKSGYVLKTFVAAEAPPEHRMRELEERVKAQTAELQELRYENTQLKETKAKIEREASAADQRLRELEEERAELRRNNNLRWFLAGAGVLLLGWLMGWTRLRSRRRRTFS